MEVLIICKNQLDMKKAEMASHSRDIGKFKQHIYKAEDAWKHVVRLINSNINYYKLWVTLSPKKSRPSPLIAVKYKSVKKTPRM